MQHPTAIRRRTIFTSAIAAAGLAACGNEEQVDSPPSPTSTRPTPTRPAPTPTPTPTPTKDVHPPVAPTLQDPYRIIADAIPPRGIELSPDQDCEILPGVMTHGLVVRGGRNVIVRGVDVRVPGADVEPNYAARRGIQLIDQTGVAHVEHTLISGAPADGFFLNQSQGATVQLLFVRIENLTDVTGGNHPDAVQAIAGPRVLNVYGLQAITSYQGLTLQPFQAKPDAKVDRWSLSKVAIDGSQGGSYLLWVDKAMLPKLDLSEVYLKRVDGSDGKAKIEGADFADVPGVLLDQLPSREFVLRSMVGPNYGPTSQIELS